MSPSSDPRAPSSGGFAELPRLRLIPDFAACTPVQSVAIIAPPFSGKTTLARQIAAAARQEDWQVDWFDGRRGGAALADFLNDMATGANDGRAHLVIVDDHQCASCPTTDVLLHHLLADVGGKVTLALISRSDPGRLLAAARLRGAMVEIGPADLAFTRGEAADMLGVNEVERRSEDFRLIMRSTNGWVAGLCQIRDTLARGGDLATARRALSGAFGLLRELIENEILADVPDHDRDLLRRLAPFSTITPDLIGSLTDDRPMARLASLRRTGLLTQPSPERPDCYSMNPLQSQYLEAELKDLAPETWRALLLKATAGYLATGRGLAAADCLLRAQDYEGASKVLGDYADQAFASLGEIREFFALCQRLPSEFAERFDRTFWIARSAALAGSFGYAARLIKELETEPGDGRGGSDRLEVIRILVALGYGEFPEVLKRGWPLLSSDRGPPLDRAMVALALAQASAAMLDLVGYGQALERARAEAARAPAGYFQAWVAILSTMRLSTQGRLSEAGAELERALVSLDLSGPIRHTCELVLANYKRGLGQYAEAQALVDRSFRAGARHGISETVFASLEVASKLKLRTDGVDAALTMLSEAEVMGGARLRRILPATAQAPTARPSAAQSCDRAPAADRMAVERDRDVGRLSHPDQQGAGRARAVAAREAPPDRGRS